MSVNTFIYFGDLDGCSDEPFVYTITPSTAIAFRSHSLRLELGIARIAASISTGKRTAIGFSANSPSLEGVINCKT